jgi:hypothetical protein
MGGIWALAPVPVVPAQDASAEIRLPSPYDMLSSLGDRSPAGKPLRIEQQAQFLTIGRQAPNPEEASFWKRWAARAMLENRGRGVAATLSDFATEIANTYSDESGLAAARFLWEMAALSQDCAAMHNIAASLTASSAANSELVRKWNDLARRCTAGK